MDDQTLSQQRNSSDPLDQQLWDFPRPSNNTFLQWQDRNSKLLFEFLPNIFTSLLKQKLPHWGDVFDAQYDVLNVIGNDARLFGRQEGILVLNKKDAIVTYEKGKNFGTINGEEFIHEVGINSLIAACQIAIEVASECSKDENLSMLPKWGVSSSTENGILSFTITMQMQSHQVSYKVTPALKEEAGYLLLSPKTDKDKPKLTPVDPQGAASVLRKFTPYIGFVHMIKVLRILASTTQSPETTELIFESATFEVAKLLGAGPWKQKTFIELFQQIVDFTRTKLQNKTLLSLHYRLNLADRLNEQATATFLHWLDELNTLDASNLYEQVKGEYQKHNGVDTADPRKGKNVAANRATGDPEEIVFWNFTQDRLVVDEVLLHKQTINRAALLPGICSVVEHEIKSHLYVRDELKALIKLRPELVGSVLNETNVLGSDDDIMLVLADDFHVHNGIPIVKGKEGLIHEVSLNAIAEACSKGIRYLARNQSTSGLYEPWELKSDGANKKKLILQIQSESFDYDLLPAFQHLNSTFYVIEKITEPKKTIILTPSSNRSVAFGLKLLKDDYYGLLEMIKVCKVFSKEWNARQEVKDLELYVPSSVFESVAVAITGSSEMTTNDWNKDKAVNLFKMFFRTFLSALVEENVPVLNNTNQNLIKHLKEKDLTPLANWINELLTIPTTEILLAKLEEKCKLLEPKGLTLKEPSNNENQVSNSNTTQPDNNNVSAQEPPQPKKQKQDPPVNEAEPKKSPETPVQPMDVQESM